MQIDSARRVNGGMFLEVSVRETADFLSHFKSGEYEIVKAKHPRSLNANAYCWVLCDKIGKKLRQPKEQIYRDAIRDAGVFEAMIIKAEGLEKFNRIWSSRGTGWFTETADIAGGWAQIHAYYGSSTYDREQMARLIDGLIQNAKAIGIETEDEEYTKSLLANFNQN